jgi:hypothetical protein
MEHTKAEEQDRHHLVQLRSHLERCLQDIWSMAELMKDADQDYPYRNGTAACWVSVVTGPVPGVRVFAHAAHGLRSSAKLLAEVNEINTRSRWATVSYQGGIAVVSTAVHWAAVDRLALAHAIGAVADVAADIGSLLAGVYGGSTPFPPELAEQDQNANEEAA